MPRSDRKSRDEHRVSRRNFTHHDYSERNKSIERHHGRRHSRSRSRSPHGHGRKSNAESRKLQSLMDIDTRDFRKENRSSRSGEFKSSSSRLRMDEESQRRRKHQHKDEKGKNSKDLERAVQKAREEKSLFWDKKILKEEKKFPERWDHGGYKEMYTKDLKRNSPSSSRKKLVRPEKRRIAPVKSSFATYRRNSRSRSRSYDGRRKNMRTDIKDLNKESDFRQREIKRKELMKDRDRRLPIRVRGRATVPEKKSHPAEKKRVAPRKGSPDRPRDRSSYAAKARAKVKNSQSRSRSRSRSLSISTESPPSPNVKSRPSLSSPLKSSMKKVGLKKSKRNKSSSPSLSRSEMSSSSSSDDNDVLQLHAKRRESSSLSSSRSRSNSAMRKDKPRKSRSVTSISSSSRSPLLKRNRRGDHSSLSSTRSKEKVRDSSVSSTSSTMSSSSVSSLSKSEGDRVKRTEKERLTNKSSPKFHSKEKTKASLERSSNNTANKTVPSVSPKVVSTTSKGKDPSSRKSGGKSSSESDSGSESGETDSSSESEATPKMTLSERFSKLTQMSTDKREFSKPLLKADEMDTKLKVVKDFRNSDTRILLSNEFGKPEERPSVRTAPEKYNSIRERGRSLSPKYSDDGSYTIDERTRHFSKMDRMDPSERPSNWSDPRVRYNYYRDRGFFNERPLIFEEFVKWESWWYDYRDWLVHEGYYDNNKGPMAQPHPQHRMGPGPRPARPMFMRGRNNMHHAPPMRRVPLGQRVHFGGPEGTAYLRGAVRREVPRPHFMPLRTNKFGVRPLGLGIKNRIGPVRHSF